MIDVYHLRKKTSIRVHSFYGDNSTQSYAFFSYSPYENVLFALSPVLRIFCGKPGFFWRKTVVLNLSVCSHQQLVLLTFSLVIILIPLRILIEQGHMQIYDLKDIIIYHKNYDLINNIIREKNNQKLPGQQPRYIVRAGGSLKAHYKCQGCLVKKKKKTKC